jgi:eukaryotic-like serine/threonine-protein kinase
VNAFALRLRLPVLMVNGRYDFSFSLDRAQRPLFDLLGTPAESKRRVVLDTPHDVRAHRAELISAVLSWLDRYLGPVGGR